MYKRFNQKITKLYDDLFIYYVYTYLFLFALFWDLFLRETFACLFKTSEVIFFKHHYQRVDARLQRYIKAKGKVV